MKPISFLGDSWDVIRDFPDGPRRRAARGAERIGPGRLADRVLVLHAFQKKTQQTAQRDIELAARRLREWKAQQ